MLADGAADHLAVTTGEDLGRPTPGRNTGLRDRRSSHGQGPGSGRAMASNWSATGT